MDRRIFLQKTAAGMALLGTGVFPLKALSPERRGTLTLLHTNDWHGAPLQNLAKEVQRIRAEGGPVLLLDAGGWMPEEGLDAGYAEAFGQLGYDAVTLGDWDWPLSQVAQAHGWAYPALIAHEGMTQEDHGSSTPAAVIHKGGWRIGILAVGANASSYDRLEQQARVLKQEQGCDLVVCLSRLGYCHSDGSLSDLDLAAQTEHIDVVFGGQTHTFMESAAAVRNAAGRTTWVQHAGYGGVLLGRLDLDMVGHGIALREGAVLAAGAVV